MEEMTPEDVREAKERRRAEQAYNRSLTSTEAAPMASAASSPAKPKRSAAIEESIQEAKDEQARRKIKAMGYKKGGSVKSSASSRADGIAQRGKTKGRML